MDAAGRSIAGERKSPSGPFNAGLGEFFFSIAKGHGHVQAGGSTGPQAAGGPTIEQETVGLALPAAAPTVGLVDVGLPPGWAHDHPWLMPAITVEDSGLDTEPLDVQTLDSWKGFAPVHELFVAGLIRRVAPTVRILRSPSVSVTGGFSEDDLVASLGRLLRLDHRPEVVNLSLGCFTDDNAEPPRLAAVVKELADHGVAVVAAAGNGASRDRNFWPAASDGVFAVGALAGAGSEGPADFSNSGKFVDLWAPGSAVVSSFLRTEDFVDPRTRGYFGWARWSGMSFAAPIFSALIAARVGANPGTTGRQAADDILAELPVAPWAELDRMGGGARLLDGRPGLGVDVLTTIMP